MDRFEECIEVFRKKIHVELDTLIECRNGVDEESRIMGRIEAGADMVRFMEGRLPAKDI